MYVFIPRIFFVSKFLTNTRNEKSRIARVKLEKADDRHARRRNKIFPFQSSSSVLSERIDVDTLIPRDKGLIHVS